MAKNKDRKILGIDPGTNVLGYAFIKVENKVISLESMGIIWLKKYEDPYTKLQKIQERLHAMITMFKPDEMGVEAPFYGKNVQSMLKLGRAQGVAIATAMSNGVSVAEYSPKKIKQSITGNGNASKEQVAAMVMRMLKIDKLPKYNDSTDALGVAICHHLQTQNKLKLGGSDYKDWKAFAASNPKKVKK
ncbi:UNVERIFIED_CONTAM: hypothetical protein GTU68_049684 [Idotea baltica]|nr:hypothetical protein [Idotea baltica]